MMAAVPYRDMNRAADIILKCFPEAPCLPIMTRSLRWMFEGIPCLIIDREKKQVRMAPPEERESEVIEFYERIEQDDLDYFATSPQTAPFFHEMINRLRGVSEVKWVIFRTVGPVVLGDTIKQTNGNPSIHHETLFDIIVMRKCSCRVVNVCRPYYVVTCYLVYQVILGACDIVVC